MSSDTALLRLLQLVSPTLPVGAYAYSQGLESAVEAGWITDEAGAGDWIQGLLTHGVGRLDAPVLIRLHGAWVRDDMEAVRRWNRFLYASRESAELQAEDRTLARALVRLLRDLGVVHRRELDDWRDLSYPTLFALAAVRWHVPCAEAVQGYLWAWLENQVAAAIKLVPLGQTAGQRIQMQVGAGVPAVWRQAMEMADDDIGQLTHGLAMASAWHETQYSRLFRS